MRGANERVSLFDNCADMRSSFIGLLRVLAMCFDNINIIASAKF